MQANRKVKCEIVYETTTKPITLEKSPEESDKKLFEMLEILRDKHTTAWSWLEEDLTLESSASSEIENATRPNLFNESEIVEQ